MRWQDSRSTCAQAVDRLFRFGVVVGKQAALIPETRISERQRLFCERYVIHLDGELAASEAGYSRKSARQISYKLVRKRNIAAYIGELLDKKAARNRVDADDVLREISRIAHLDIRRAFREDGTMLGIHDLPDDVAAAIASIEMDEIYEGAGSKRSAVGVTKKVRFAEKLRALELLGKHLRLFPDKVEVSGEKLTVEQILARDRSAGLPHE